MLRIWVCVAGILLLSIISGFCKPLLSFDTREIVDSFVYPKVNKSDPEIQRNISLTLSVYQGFCGLYRQPEFKKYEEQIEQGKTILRMNGEGLTFRDLEAITYSLRVNKTVRIIDFSGNYFGNGAVESLSNLLSENETIKTMDLGNCYIGPDGIKVLENYITAEFGKPSRITNLNPPSVRDRNLSLYLSACFQCNFLPDWRWISFFKANDYAFRIPYQPEGKNMKSISFYPSEPEKTGNNSDNVSSEQWMALAEVIQYTDTIADVLFQGEITNEPGLDVFIQSFGINGSITNISIHECRMEDETAAIFYESFIGNHKVSVLNIDRCEISDNSMKSLSRLFAANQSIKSFTFNNNKTSEKAALDLLKTLCYRNESVDKLVIKGMVIPEDRVLSDLKKKYPEREGIQ